jgi:hypothetical protein
MIGPVESFCVFDATHVRVHISGGVAAVLLVLLLRWCHVML